MNNKLITILAIGLCGTLTTSADLVHRYSFNDPAGSLTATDSVGGLAWSATLNNEASLDGSQLVLNPNSGTGFAQLPAGVITNANAVTLESWVSFGTQVADWSRLFSFGFVNDQGGVVSEFRLTPRAPGNYLDVSYATPAGSAYANRPQGLDNQQNVHLVVVLNPAAGILATYTNGVLVTGAPNGTLPPLSTLTNVQSYLGKSFYPADPYLVGSFDEFRIWNEALTRAQIEASYEAGPNNVSTNPGALKSIQLSLPLSVTTVNSSETVVLTGAYANLTNTLVLSGSPGIVYASGNTNIVTIATNGLLQAVGTGTTTVSANYLGFGSTQSVTVVQNFIAPSHRYSFNDANGSPTAADSIGGAAWNGTLFGDAVITNGQLRLDGADNTYLNLPAQIVGHGLAVTVEAWASFGVQSRDWSRLFSFGQLDAQNNPQEQFRLSPRSGANWVDAFYLGADANHPTGLDLQTNVHIVVVADPPSGFLGIYTNGVLIGQSSQATTPLSPAPDQLSYVGKSIYPADPYLIGSIDEFRVYEGALTPDRIAVDLAAGPNNVVTNPGALQSARLVIPQIRQGEALHALFTGTFANVSNVDLFVYGKPTFSSSDTNVVTIDSSGRVTAVGSGTATVSVNFNGFQSSQAVTVAPALLTHRYSFNDATSSTTASDSIGGSAWNGTLNGDATLDGTNLVLDGGGGYVQLPAQVIGGYSAVTFETWVSFGANAQWARLWDFGEQNPDGSGKSSAYFTPHNGANGMQMTMFKPNAGTDVILSTNLDGASEMQVVGVYTGNYMELYFNGVLAGRTSPVSLSPQDINDVNSFIGKSMFNADPTFTGSVDEFRIYQGALTAGQVASDFAAGPNSVPLPAPKLGITLGQGKVTITWPASASNYILQSSTSVTGGWGPSGLTVTQQNGQNVATDTVSGSAKFYRLQKGP
ncbi:MAG TPA: LamG-like jellyroll fold domain-containing protein [Verrucomicrobiae bacterium]|nr:LamG-like jellyroll fold domain-containing protein [Verrucomicrobiae bacterium]